MSNLLKIYRFEGLREWSWLALFREGKIRRQSGKHTLADVIEAAKQIGGVKPATKRSIKLRDECVRGEHEDCCVWTWATGIRILPTAKSWHSEPNATSIPKPEMKHWGAIPTEELHRKLEENPQTRIPDQMRVDKEFPFAYPKLADSFEEFDYSVNAPSEGGSDIGMMVKDDYAAEQILRARIARQQKWPFCPVHQRNVDLAFRHLIITHVPSHNEMLRHGAYWICRQCQAKK